jgi:putative addiction module component (TIGR02574 family)
MTVTDIPNFELLTDLERLQLAEELMASIRNPGALPEPLAHRLELEPRWAEYEADPRIALSEDQFWNSVRARKG